MSFFALTGEDVGDLACRPGDRTVRPDRDLIDPALVFVRGKHTVLAVRTRLDETAVIAARNNALPVGRAGEDGARMDRHAALGLAVEKKRLLTEHEDRRRTQKMNADDRRAGVEAPHTIGQ